jgi:hypothetical protein
MFGGRHGVGAGGNRMGRFAWMVALPLMAAALLSAAPAVAAASTAPALVGSVTDPVNNTLSGTTSTAVSGNYAYTTAYYSGQLTAIDISNPKAPFVAGSSSPFLRTTLLGSSTVNIAGGYAFVASKNRNASASSNDDGSGNSLTILDIHTNPAQPTYVGSVQDPARQFGAYGVAVSGNYAYVAAQGLLAGQPSAPDTSNGAFDVIDISTLATPRIVATIDNSSLTGALANGLDHADSVAVSGNYAYVTASYPPGGGGHLTVIDISTPTSPKVIKTLGSAPISFPVDVALQGNYAYVANQTSSAELAVIDVSNPASPQPVGSVTSSALQGAYRIRLAHPASGGNFAYISASSVDAISAVDISDPAHPRLAGTLADSGHLHRTTGLDVDSTGGYVIANSPYLSTQSNATYPPYPFQTGGGTTTGTISAIQLDPNAIAATITPSSEPPNGTAQRSATFAFSASDDVSTFRCGVDGAALSLCSGGTSQSYSSLGPGSHTFTVQAIDAVGNVSSPATYTWTITGPAPSVSITTPANNQSYAQNHLYNASYICTAATGTTVASCTGPVASGSPIDTSTTGTHTFTVTATDADGGTVTSSTSYTVTAASPPTISIATPPNGATYTQHQAVVAAYTCTAAASTTLSSCSGPLANGAAIDTATTGPHTFTVSATDADGGAATSSTSYTVVAARAPTATLRTPAAGGTYARGSRILASYSCAAGAGTTLRSCVGTTANGARINTSTVGTYAFKVTATQSDGQAATVTHSYRVLNRPSVSAFSERAATWRVGASPDPKRQKPPVGTTFSFRLSTPARIVLAFYVRAPGRKLHGGACIAESSHYRFAPRCTRAIPASGLIITARRGSNRLTFKGRVSSHRSLRPGPYRVVITAVDADGLTSPSEALNFVIAGG